jgi:hypothetical protein
MTDAAKKVRLVLKFEDWPDQDQRVWAELTSSGTLFDDGAFAAWSDGTARLRQQGYGQWLSYLLRNCPEELEGEPADRITVSVVRGFVEECEERLKDRSIYNHVTSLLVMALAMSPDRDWCWLQRLQARLRRRLDDTSLPHRPEISADQVFDWSLRRLREVDAVEGVTDLRRAIWFRQALMIGFLISRPVRRRALLSMQLGRQIVAQPDGYRLEFDAATMKDGRDRSYPLPQQLIEAMERYIEHHRPVLLRGGSSKALWLNQYGNALTPDGLTRELPKVTERHLGVALRPHAFRHIAATSIAERDPEHVGIIRDILGHATLRMAEKHYNRAQQVESCKRFQSAIAEVKAKLPKQ